MENIELEKCSCLDILFDFVDSLHMSCRVNHKATIGEFGKVGYNAVWNLAHNSHLLKSLFSVEFTLFAFGGDKNFAVFDFNAVIFIGIEIVLLILSFKSFKPHLTRKKLNFVRLRYNVKNHNFLLLTVIHYNYTLTGKRCQLFVP